MRTGRSRRRTDRHWDTGGVSIAIPYPWVEGEAHLVKLVTSTGTTFEHEIAVAVETPRPDGRHLLAFTLIGLYVGVIPVALGLLWFPPFPRPGEPASMCLALTIGLLVFLFVDAGAEGIEAARAVPRSYQGTAFCWRGRPRTRARVVRRLALRAAIACEAGRFGQVAYWRCSSPRASTPQLRRRACDWSGVCARRSGARNAPGHRIHAAQHDRGPGHHRADRMERTVTGHARTARIDRRPPTIAGAWVGGLVYSPTLAVLFLAWAPVRSRRWCCRSPDRSIRPDR